MSEVKHVLGISGGKDSAALSIFMRDFYPSIDVEYYTCDTGKELNETYELIERLESYLGKSIKRYSTVDVNNSPEGNPFDHFLAVYGHYLPSATARWCTKNLKLEPFEQEIGDTPTISYVGIRGDEHREGYISKKSSIQSIFPFRKNIWSEDVMKLVLSKDAESKFQLLYQDNATEEQWKAIQSIVERPLGITNSVKNKANALLDFNIPLFNKVVFEFLKFTDYPVGKLEDFPLIDSTEIIRLNDVFDMLDKSGVGIPAYYKPVEYEVEIEGELKKGTYSRSRSGCFFCFFQQKIEWVWLLEQHPKLFQLAMEYEKDGYTWSEEPLSELSNEERVKQIKKDYYLKSQVSQKGDWKDEVLKAEGVGCASCFI